jgi:hypothetical protein
MKTLRPSGKFRALMASMSAAKFADHQFNVANQLNRGAALLIDRNHSAFVGLTKRNSGHCSSARGAIFFNASHPMRSAC